MTKKEKKPIFSSSTKTHIIRAFLGVFPFPLYPGLEIVNLIKDLTQSRTSSDEKIEKAYNSLQETSKLIGELEESLNERTKKLILLREKIKRYSKLAEVEEDKAKAFINQLEVSLGNTRNRGYWMSLFISLIAGLFVFILGILLSPIFKTWFGIGG